MHAFQIKNQAIKSKELSEYIHQGVDEKSISKAFQGAQSVSSHSFVYCLSYTVFWETWSLSHGTRSTRQGTHYGHADPPTMHVFRKSEI